MKEDMYFDDSSEPKNSFDNFFIGLLGSFAMTAIMVYLVSKGYLKEDIGVKETRLFIIGIPYIFSISQPVGTSFSASRQILS